MAINEDITGRKKADEALKESEIKYRDLFETVQEVFYIDRLIYDEKGNIIDWIFEDLNPAGLRLLGFDDLAAAKGKRGSEVLGSKVASFYLPLIEEARRSKKAVTFQYDSPYVDKKFLTSYVVRGDRLISAQMDITEIKMAQRKVEEEHARLHAVLDNIPVAVGFTNAQGGVVLDNGILASIWRGSHEMYTVSDYQEYKAWWPETKERVKANEWPSARALNGEGVAPSLLTSRSSMEHGNDRRVRQAHP